MQITSWATSNTTTDRRTAKKVEEIIDGYRGKRPSFQWAEAVPKALRASPHSLSHRTCPLHGNQYIKIIKSINQTIHQGLTHCGRHEHQVRENGGNVMKKKKTEKR